ncbi:MAG TPA: hypothetical protein VF070_31530 [Streptosporangiaceae bacterium]
MSGNVLAAGHDLVVHDVRRDAAAGHDLVVHDVRRDARAGLEAAGARWAALPHETGARWAASAREAGAGLDGGEMLAGKLYRDLTRTPLRLSQAGANPC